MSNLTGLIKDITYFYVKYFYELELQNTNKTILEEEELKDMITRLYFEKSNDLKKYIRETLKENLQDKYSAFAVENILLEMFTNPEMSKHRIFLEIDEYQKRLT